MHALLRNVRFGLRLMFTRASLTIGVVLSLALGIGANTAVFSYVDAVLLKPLPYESPQSLIFLWASDNVKERRGISGPDLDDIRARARSVEEIAAFINHGPMAARAGESFGVSCAEVDARLFSVLGVQPLLGRSFLRGEDAPGADGVIVISYGLWNSNFGSRSEVLGRSIVLNDRIYAVVGVMPPGFFFPTRETQAWIPLSQSSWPSLNERGVPLVHAVARMKNGVRPEEAQHEINNITKQLSSAFPTTDEGLHVGVFPAYQVILGNYERALFALLGAVTMVLLISCANVTNLLLAQGSSRRHEIAIRSACGASRAVIVCQLLTESMLYAAAGGALGVVLASGGLRAIQALHLTDIPRFEAARLDLRVLLFCIVTSVAAGIISGLIPAWRYGRLNLAECLKEAGQVVQRGRRSQAQHVLAAAEVALTLVLLVTAGLLIRSFVALQSFRWGIKPDRVNVVFVSLPPEMARSGATKRDFLSQALERLRATPGVESASVSYGVPVEWGSWLPTFLAVDGQVRTVHWAAARWDIGEDYFGTMGIRVIKGQEFESAVHRATTGSIVVSQALAQRLWGDKDPIGRQVQALTPTETFRKRIAKSQRLAEADYQNPDNWEKERLIWTVIGEVEDVNMFGLGIVPPPPFYVEISQPSVLDLGENRLRFVVRTKSGSFSTGMAADAICSADHRVTITKVEKMSDILSRAIGARGSTALLLFVSNGFGGLALMMTVLGLYAVMAYSVSQRTHEIAVRVALGGQHWHIMRLILCEGLAVITAGLLLGLFGVLVSTRLLVVYLYEISPTDSTTLVLISLLVVLVGLFACYVPARRAIRIDINTVLRCG